MSSYPKRREIYWANLDPTIGSEIAKIRPVLIVSNDINNQYAATVSVLPITSNVSKVYPYEVIVSPQESGLKKPSKVKANQIRTLDKRRIGKKMGFLKSVKMKEINQAMLIHLAMDE